MKKLFIETYGCLMNVADSEVVASIMQSDGFELTDTIIGADAILVNTCSIRDNAEQKVISRLQYFQRLIRVFYVFCSRVEMFFSLLSLFCVIS